ncbi:MAG TPA: amidase [Bryobacteraceae bacterium]|nr:amidase [Bryobacteraceae bacterium]
MNETASWTIHEAGLKLRRGDVSCRELVQHALASAERIAHLNAFITVTGEEALQQAEELDRELREGRDRGPLHGIPIALKDLFYTRGVRTTNGSRLFADFVPDYDATVVVRLREAGAVSIGKLNQHELAYGITSNNPHFGPVRNPHNPDCIPGGSSGGSGVAVAAGTVFCAMGSDTGGSIRIPASLCGTVGLKPTFGRVSRYGCFPLGFTLDHMGPLTRTPVDAALVLNAIGGRDGRDVTVRREAGEDFTWQEEEVSLAGVRVGVPENFYNSGLAPSVREAWDRAIRNAGERGALLVRVQVPDPEGLVAAARTILMAEAVAALEPYLERREEFGADLLALMDQGRAVTGYAYVNAQRRRERLSREYKRLFNTIDVLITPATPVPAPRIGQATVSVDGTEYDTRLLMTSFARGVNALGLPAVSVPFGRSTEGLPLGLQLIARPWQERTLLQIAEAFMHGVEATPAATM